jgi:hypothetical protein
MCIKATDARTDSGQRGESAPARRGRMERVRAAGSSSTTGGLGATSATLTMASTATSASVRCSTLARCCRIHARPRPKRLRTVSTGEPHAAARRRVTRRLSPGGVSASHSYSSKNAEHAPAWQHRPTATHYPPRRRWESRRRVIASRGCAWAGCRPAPQRSTPPRRHQQRHVLHTPPCGARRARE